MKHFSYSLVATFLSISLSSNGQQNLFSKVYYYAGVGIQGYDVTQAYDNGFVVVGEYDNKAFVMKIDSAGNMIWNKTIGTQYQNAFNGITKTVDSNFVLAGKYHEVSSNHFELICVKINQSGDTLWSKNISAGKNDYPMSIDQTFDHGFIISGYTDTIFSSFPTTRIMVVKTDSAGNLEWRKSIVVGNNANYGRAAKQTPDSGFVITAYDESISPLSLNQALIKLTPSGNLQWAKKYNRIVPVYSNGLDLLVLPTGIINYISIDYNVSVLMKTDFSGNIIWQKEYNFGCGLSSGSINEPKPKINLTSDGGYLLSNGALFCTSSIIKTDSLGNLQWGKNVANNLLEAIETKDNGIILLGNGPLGAFTPHSSTLDPQLAIIKTDSLGSGVVCTENNFFTSTSDSLIAIPISTIQWNEGISSSFYPVATSNLITIDSACVAQGSGLVDKHENDITLSPNPVTSQLIVNGGKIKIEEIKIFDLLGKIIYEYKILNPKSVINIDFSTLSKGIYFVETTTTHGIVRNKFVKE